MSAPRRLTARAPAKVNLDLRVLGRRADGYHLLESLVVFADTGDVVHADASTDISLHVTGEYADAAGAGEGNLVRKAATALRVATGTTQGAALVLEKNIPVGAGLGGGSADAAATLHVLNRLWNTGLDKAALHAVAQPLGADVAMCLESTPVIARGIGDELQPAIVPRLHAVLVHPRVPLLTAEVYRALVVAPPATMQATPAAFTHYRSLIAYLQQSSNDLEQPATAICPAVVTLLETLATLSPKADLVRMTGSGACCFALYETRAEAQAAASALAQRHAHWWIEAVTLGR